jgi:hypothetical protein
MSHSRVWALTAVVLSTSVGLARQEPPTASQLSLRRHYLDLLLKEGFSGHVGANGSVAFKVDNRMWEIQVKDGDPHYIEISSVDLWHPHAQDRASLLEAANRTMIAAPTVKVLLTDKQIRFAAQFYVASPNDLSAPLPGRKTTIFGAAVADLKSAKRHFDAQPKKLKTLTPLDAAKEFGEPVMPAGGAGKPPISERRSKEDPFQRVDSAEGGYFVEMPGRPLNRNDDLGGGMAEKTLLVLSVKGNYAVSHIDLKGSAANVKNVRAALKGFVAGTRQGVAIENEKEISLGGRAVPGLEYECKEQKDLYVRERVYADGPRLHRVYVSSKDRTFLRSADAERFFKSFALIEVRSEPVKAGCHPGCFPAGSVVRVPGGTKTIETVAFADWINTIKPDGALSKGIVVKVFKTRNRLVVVQTGMGRLLTTELQPFCLIEGGVRPAGELKKGAKVWGWRDGKRVSTTVEGIEAAGRSDEVFNLVLADQADFVVNDHVVRSKPPEAKSSQSE